MHVTCKTNRAREKCIQNSLAKKKEAGNYLENIDIDVTVTLKAADQLSFFQVEFYSVN
jgi:hypothetical protein